MPKNDRLYYLMGQLEHGDLLFLLKYGLGKTDRKYRYYTTDRLKDLISSELRRVGGHRWANFFRFEHDFPYKQILIDVADRLSEHRTSEYKLNDDHSEEEIEKTILRLFELKTKKWWEKLDKKGKKETADKISRIINEELVNSVNRMTYIKHRISKEVMDSIITKGIVVGMLAVSAGGLVGTMGGSLLTRIGLAAVIRTKGAAFAMKILMRGLGGFTGKGFLDLIGGLIAGVAVFVPSTIYFYADTDYRRTIPTIIMLLSRVHLKKVLGHEINSGAEE
ncbi:MAG: hypothetical protein B6245_01275 [Desulfobacteraceae bacterium 4572_88]|nr:MAG: hypothetical protein B6245_01275 [Desulfobacteraceae bacterium 4572_88]